MTKSNIGKFAAIILSIIVLTLFATSCDQSIIDVYTQVNTDYSGIRSVSIAIKTDYIQKGEVVLGERQSLLDEIIETLPDGEIETYEKDNYTYFESTVSFNDINFLQHVSIDNFSDTQPERFYAKMEKEDYFFYSDYFLYDYIDMKIDESLLSSTDEDSSVNRANDLFSADDELLKITYQVKFPVKITESNADTIGDGNIAIWDLKYGQQRNIFIKGKKTKLLTYFLLVILGFIGIFILLIIFMLIFSSRRRKPKNRKPGSSFDYDNYFKRDKYFDE